MKEGRKREGRKEEKEGKTERRKEEKGRREERQKKEGRKEGRKKVKVLLTTKPIRGTPPFGLFRRFL